MELFIVDGFDHYGSNDAAMTFWGPANNDGLQTSIRIGSGGPDGTNKTGFEQNSSNTWSRDVYKQIPPITPDPDTIYGVSFHCNIPTNAFNQERAFPSWGDNSTKGKVRAGPSAGLGQLGIIGTSNADVTYSANDVVTPNTWAHIETHFEKGSGVNWVFTLRVSGVTILTKEIAAPSSFNRCNLLSNTGNASIVSLDNVIFYTTPKSENEWLGETNIVTILPSSDVVNEWQSTGSSAWSVLDNVPAVSGQYISSDTPGDIVTVGLKDLPNTDIAIKGVSVGYSASKTGTDLTQTSLSIPGAPGTPDTLLQGSFRSFSKTFLINPATGLPWTPNDVNGLEVTLKREA